MKSLKQIWVLVFTLANVVQSFAFDSETISKAVQGCGQVISSSVSNTNAHVVVIEENHANIPVHIQEALILERLYKLANLRYVGVEGYLVEEAKTNLDVGWFNLATGQPTKRNEIATAFLEQGEINAGEFMKLVHDDLTLIPVERAQDYVTSGETTGLDVSGLTHCRLKLSELLEENPSKEFRENLAEIYEQAARSLRASDFKGMKVLSREMAEKRTRVFGKSREELTDDQDLKKGVRLEKAAFDRSHSSIEAEIEFMNEVTKLASAKGKPFSAKQAEDVVKYKSYLESRANASGTMVNQIFGWASTNNTGCYALIIGAGHTSRVIQNLKEKGMAYSVIHPSAMEDPAGGLFGLGIDYDQKMKQESIDNSALGEVLNDVYPAYVVEKGSSAVVKIKPKLVLNKEWLRAKSETYTLIDAINRWNLQGSKTPFKAPKTDLVVVDPESIKEITEQGESVVQFRLDFRKDGEVKGSLWVKAKAAAERVPSVEAEREVETLLKNALDRCRKSGRGENAAERENETKSDKSIDDRLAAAQKDFERAYIEHSQKRITESTIAVFAPDLKSLKSIEFTK